MNGLHKSLTLLGAASLLAGCVTINIYFPAAAAEKAADKIIDQVWQLKNAPSDGKKAPPAAQPGEAK